MCSTPSPVVINNNPKLKSLLEPFIIPTYGQLKQPNANSAFQSSVISSTGMATGSASSGIPGSSGASNPGGLLSLSSAVANNPAASMGGGPGSSMNGPSSINQNLLTSLTGSNLAASAFSSAVLVTENVTNFGNIRLYL